MSRSPLLGTDAGPSLRRAPFAAVIVAIAVGLWILLSHGQSYRASDKAAISTCRSSQLTARVGFIGAALGHMGVSVYLANHSGLRCVLDGYPSLQMLTATGRRLPTFTSTGPSYTIPPMKPHRVLLSEEASATLFIGVADGTGIPDNCPASTRVAITPPGDKASITIGLRLPAYGGPTHQIRCGTVSVSPVIAGIHKRT